MVFTRMPSSFLTGYRRGGITTARQRLKGAATRHLVAHRNSDPISEFGTSCFG